MTSLPKGLELFLPDPPFDPIAKGFSWWEQRADVAAPLSHTAITAEEVVERLRALAQAIEEAVVFGPEPPP